MNSFERKIVHDVVREEGMKSRSHGEEPRRYVTVYLKASAAEDTEDEDEPEFGSSRETWASPFGGAFLLRFF